MAFVWKLASAVEKKHPQKHPISLDPTLSSVPLMDVEPTSNDWQRGLPQLTGTRVTLRELRSGDAVSLLTAAASDEVRRYISPPPATVEGFEQFITWAQRQRVAGQCASFAIVPRGSDVAIGLFHLRSLQPSFCSAEWGFLMAPEFWGSGIFTDSARLVVEFAFEVLRAHRLEARAALRNLRANAALGKLGAVREGVLRKSFLRNGELLDQAMWTILADDWAAAQQPRVSQVIH
jgi:[ribosomal protein S5]-alanine N-acetyltransferase